MHLWDVVLPINLGPLTYRCPDELSSSAMPGRRVTVPIRHGTAVGILLKKTTSAPKGNIRDIASIDTAEPVFSQGMLRLLIWLSEYYLSTEGMILKQAVPSEMLEKVKQRKSAGRGLASLIDIPYLNETDIKSLLDIIGHKGYKTILFHAPSAAYEFSSAACIFRKHHGVLMLFPEIISAERFYNSMSQEPGNRTCLLHGEMSAGKRSETIEGIMSGRYDLIVGTRTALFAPLKPLSLIMVMQEHSSAYKLEEGVMFNVRDAAVMRGFLEKVPVILSSSSPSLESWFNAKTGKYMLFEMKQKDVSPKTRILNMPAANKVRPYLSKNAYDEAKRQIAGNGKVLFFINRRGHSSILNCTECGHTASCEACNIPLVLHKDKGCMSCHYCSRSISIPDSCSRCGSHSVEFLGAGTQKIEEDIAELFGADTLRFDKDKAGSRNIIRKMADEATAEHIKAVIGTKMITSHLPRTGCFKMAVLLNPDLSLNVPDFRAREKTFQELAAVRDLILPGGSMVIQTRMPQDPAFRYFRDNDYESFAAEELTARKALAFPPYSRIMNITASGSSRMPDRIIEIINMKSEAIEILGPAEKKTKKGKTEYCFLLKHGDRKVLHEAAKAVIENFRAMKGTNIRVDVDPY